MKELVLEKKYSEVYTMPSGKKFVLPIRYEGWRCISAFFTADARAVRTALPSDKLKPLLMVPGKAVIVLMGMEYRMVDQLAPYNEFMVGVLVQYRPLFNIPGWPALFNPIYRPGLYSRLGVYVHYLPVTTEEAREGGVEGYGYPKSVNDIAFTNEGGAITCDLVTDGIGELSLKVKEIPVKHMKLNFNTWSVKDDRLLYTPIETIGDFGVRAIPGGAELTLGEGPIADDLRDLGIGNLAVGGFNGFNIDSLLHAPKELLPL
ncbi:MAG: acetoacetate decarboxylase family protein [Nitrospirota bacterium]|nr:MAG: acetoacetate decarboxylase family protein [Nitrospirota bacterium]